MLDTPRANLPIGTATARWPQRHLLDVDHAAGDENPLPDRLSNVA